MDEKYEVDQYGIELTPQVRLARDAAEKMEAIMENNSYFAVQFESNGEKFELPAGILPVVLDLLHGVGEGFDMTVVRGSRRQTPQMTAYAKSRDVKPADGTNWWSGR